MTLGKSRWQKALVLLAVVFAAGLAINALGWLRWTDITTYWFADHWTILAFIVAGSLLFMYTLGRFAQTRSLETWHLWWPTPVFLIAGTTLFLFQCSYFPDWLVRSSTGVQTVLQSIPATVIALLVLAFTTLFVIVQQTVSVFSNRAPLVLAQDARVKRIVLRTALVALIAVLISGQTIEPSEDPPSWLTSLCATLVLATVLLVVNYLRFVLFLVIDYSSPRSFIGLVSGAVPAALTRDSHRNTTLVYTSILGQSLRYALRRDDSEVVKAALEGFEDTYNYYSSLAMVHPEVSTLRYADNTIRTGWIADELRKIFVESAEEALGLGAPAEELDWIVDHLGNILYRSIRSGQCGDAKLVIEGHVQIGISPHLVQDKAINFVVRPLFVLAAAEKISEEQQENEIAAWCLASWSMTLVYYRVHFGVRHPQYEESRSVLGSGAPWSEAIALVRSVEWARRWANQFRPDEMALAAEVLRANSSRSNDGSLSEERALKRGVYAKWDNLIETIATWQFDGTTPEDHKAQLEITMAHLHMFGSPLVKFRVTKYMDAVGRGLEAVFDAVQPGTSVEAQRAAAQLAFSEAMRPEAEAVREAMNADLEG